MLQGLQGNVARSESDSWSGLLPTLVFVDLLFFPRLLFAFGIPVSLLIVIESMTRQRLRVDKAICLTILACVMLASVVFGTATAHNGDPFDAFKRALQLTSILLYAFYRFDAVRVWSSWVKVLRAFYIYAFCAMLLFYLYPDLFGKLLGALYPEAMDEFDENVEHLRFAYFFTDPNSAGYFMCFALVAYLWLEGHARWRAFCTVLAAITIATTQSRGAYVALVLILANSLYVSDARRRTKAAIVVAIGVVVLIIAGLYYDEISQVYSIFEARFDQKMIWAAVAPTSTCTLCRTSISCRSDAATTCCATAWSFARIPISSVLTLPMASWPCRSCRISLSRATGRKCSSSWCS